MSSRIADIIKKANLLTREEFTRALEFSNRDNINFAFFLLRNDILSESVLMKVLEADFGVEAHDLDNTDIEPTVIDCVPKDIAIQFRIIPINRLANNLIVAGGDPSNLDLIDKLSGKLSSKVKVRLASELSIQRALDKYYIHKEDNRTTTRMVGSSAEVVEGYVISYIERLLQTAANKKISDIHIEPFETSLRVRLRSDGVLIEYPDKPRFEMRDALISRVKIISGLDISEKRLPQDGCTKMDVPGVGKLDFRVSCLPSVWGEKIVLRLLDKANLQLDMTRLGFETEQLEQFKDAIHRSAGMVLVTGPTGSGKTTTLYSALSDLNRISDNVVTAEDPVEYTIPGITQVHVRPDIGFTFTDALKSFLRQDPDVIMVGEIRDLTTAEIAMKAALTGHIVLSTLHTNSAPETIERLRTMGVEVFTIISAVNAVVAQRLVRKICIHCKKEDTTHTKENLIRYGLPERYIGRFPLFKGEGCDACNGTGYKGRCAIYEVLVVTEVIKKALAAGSNALELKKIAMNNGMQTLRQSAWKKVAQGITTVDDLLESSGSDFDTVRQPPIKRSA